MGLCYGIKLDKETTEMQNKNTKERKSREAQMSYFKTDLEK